MLGIFIIFQLVLFSFQCQLKHVVMNNSPWAGDNAGFPIVFRSEFDESSCLGFLESKWLLQPFSLTNGSYFASHSSTAFSDIDIQLASASSGNQKGTLVTIPMAAEGPPSCGGVAAYMTNYESSSSLSYAWGHELCNDDGDGQLTSEAEAWIWQSYVFVSASAQWGYTKSEYSLLNSTNGALISKIPSSVFASGAVDDTPLWITDFTVSDDVVSNDRVLVGFQGNGNERFIQLYDMGVGNATLKGTIRNDAALLAFDSLLSQPLLTCNGSSFIAHDLFKAAAGNSSPLFKFPVPFGLYCSNPISGVPLPNGNLFFFDKSGNAAILDISMTGARVISHVTVPGIDFLSSWTVTSDAIVLRPGSPALWQAVYSLNDLSKSTNYTLSPKILHKIGWPYLDPFTWTVNPSSGDIFMIANSTFYGFPNKIL